MRTAAGRPIAPQVRTGHPHGTERKEEGEVGRCASTTGGTCSSPAPRSPRCCSQPGRVGSRTDLVDEHGLVARRTGRRGTVLRRIALTIASLAAIALAVGAGWKP